MALIIGILAVAALVLLLKWLAREDEAWKEAEEELSELGPHPTLGDWQWPERWREVSKVGER